MPSLGFGEILILVLIALIVFGPRRLPEIGRTVGKSMREFRRAAADLRAELEDEEPRPTFPTRPVRTPPREPAAADPSEDGEERQPDVPPT